MSGRPRGERLFRAWSGASVPFHAEGGRARFLEAPARSGPHRRLHYVVAAAAAVVFALPIFWHFTHATLHFETAAGEGHTGSWLATGDENELNLAFSEGSQVVMEPDSRGRVEELDRAGASFLLERGKVRAHVVHRSNTRWRFLAGPFEVRVTGTALDVQWDPTRERLSVHVDEGSVDVAGPRVDSVRTVAAGERCVIDVPSRTIHMSSGADAAAGDERESPFASSRGTDASTEAQASPEPSTAPAHALSPPPATSWVKLEEKGDFDGAYAAVSSSGVATVLRSASADDLLRLAQVGQLSGHDDVEREALMACRRRFPGTERAAVAAYELGRAASPNEASTWFATYLREQPAGPLAREAAGRLIEAKASAGDSTGAHGAAARYLARYPDGPHAPLARRILAGAHE